MKLPKPLLQSIALGAGIALATATACDKVEITTNLCDESCQQVKECIHVQQLKARQNNPPYYCPACGMG